MGRISEYKKDKTVETGDKVLGTDYSTGRTKNFPIDEYINASRQPITRFFSNVNVATLDHGRYKDIAMQVKDDNGEPIIHHKEVRREGEIDVYFYPKATGKAVFYP